MGQAPGKRLSIKDEIHVFEERAGQRKTEKAQQGPKQRREGDQAGFPGRSQETGQMRSRSGLTADKAGASHWANVTVSEGSCSPSAWGYILELIHQDFRESAVVLWAAISIYEKNILP